MNQRLIVIVSIVLFLLGILGIYFSGSGESSSAAQEQEIPHITYYITKRVMAAGEQVTKDDYEEKEEEIKEGEPLPDKLEAVAGYYLTESVDIGTKLVPALLTKDKPLSTVNNQHFRFTVNLNKRYVNNINGLLPGERVDVYLRFESPKREHDNKSTIFRGGSVVKIVKLFRNKKLLTPALKGKLPASDSEKSSFATSSLLDNNDEYSVDIELSRADLKKIYQIDNKYEIIIFPADSIIPDKKSENIIKKGSK
ncbi:hypothetical protein [Rosenbergiella epipactidis]|uniref:hypothetical protein n=1 Tax=Rosenbergiella epipactidis TaxID=1544694 RepID=UPI000789D6FE|nr:hypothetical protein [Rosenbergiella epipactidis]KYP95249.1 hypothetical protein WB67_06795 [bacteria symbiont BFo2 of Frankliniella occidentalis]